MAALEFQGVYYTYPGQTYPSLDNCTVKLPRHQRIALIGRNGSGKSTFFQHCNGLLQPQQGTVYIDGEQIAYGRSALKKIRQRVGIVFQQADDQLFSTNIAQDISFGPLNLGLPEDIVRQRVADAAAQCGLTQLLQRPIHAISGGEKARVALAGVLAMKPAILLVDEPTSNLDPRMRQQIFTIFDELHRRATTIIVATHEYEIARYWADLVVVMEAGKVVATGTPKQIFQDRAVLQPLGLHEPWYELFRAKNKEA